MTYPRQEVLCVTHCPASAGHCRSWCMVTWLFLIQDSFMSAVLTFIRQEPRHQCISQHDQFMINPPDAAPMAKVMR